MQRNGQFEGPLCPNRRCPKWSSCVYL